MRWRDVENVIAKIYKHESGKMQPVGWLRLCFNWFMNFDRVYEQLIEFMNTQMIHEL